MPDYQIRCEAVTVDQARTTCQKPGDVFVIGPRTPDGMCSRAFAAVYPAALAMRFSDSIKWEAPEGHLDVTCPDGFVVYRLSRIDPAAPGQGAQP